MVNDSERVRIVLLIRFWHPELPVERWRDTLDSGMEAFQAMLRRRSAPPCSQAVLELLQAPPVVPPAALKAEELLKVDAPDLAQLLEVPDDLY